ncbi:MAG: methyl-accepting chemotaxis protein [Bryobacter sp.]
MTINKSILTISFSLTALAVAFGLVFTWTSLQTNAATQRAAEISIPKTKVVTTAFRHLGDLRSETWKHVASQSQDDMREAERQIAKVDRDLQAALSALRASASTPADQQRLSEIEILRQRFSAEWEKARALSRQNLQAEALAYHKQNLRPAYLRLQEGLEAISTATGSELNQDMASLENLADLSRSTAIVGLLTCLVGGLALSRFLAARLNRVLSRTNEELDQVASQVSAAAAQVASASQQLANGSSQQVSAVEAARQNGEEIKDGAHQNSQQLARAVTVVNDSSQRFEQTSQRLQELIGAMENIDSSSQKIAKIIGVIEEIAFQTNILALNAAVEAARAGQAGMGFAVVADEVRNLSIRCADAAKDTSNLIEESLRSSSLGKEKLAAVESVFGDLVSDSGRFREIVSSVSNTSNSQQLGADVIARRLLELEKSSSNAAATAEETAAASDELESQARRLATVVGELRAIAG